MVVWLYIALGAILIPLAVTTLCETFVAALFGLQGKDLRTVIAVNLLTNPALNALFLTLWGLGVGITWGFVKVPGAPGRGGDYITAVEPWVYWALGLIEAVVVIVEWRLLVWAFAGRAGASWSVLALSFAMNAVSGGLTALMPWATSGVLLAGAFALLPILAMVAIIAIIVVVVRISRRRSRSLDVNESQDEDWEFWPPRND